MCIYTCIMQIRAENQNLVSALSITINKILCQFFEFTQNLKRSRVNIHPDFLGVLDIPAYFCY